MQNQRITIATAAATIASSTALYPIFSNFTWFYAGAGAVITVAGVGALTRRRPLGVFFSLAFGVLGLLLYLNLILEGDHSLALVIPTPGSLSGLWHLAGQGLRQSKQFAPPVDATHGLLLLTAGGIGLAGLLTDLMAVRLRGAAVAGLPLLALFIEPFTVSVNHDPYATALVFCLAAAGYLAMLSADGRNRIGVWDARSGAADFDAASEGSSSGPPGGTSGGLAGAARVPDTGGLAVAGRRVGLASVVVALIVPLLTPSLHPTRLFGGGWSLGGGNGHGNGVSLPDPFAVIHSELTEANPQPVLSYTSSDARPGYLQANVLSKLTASGWAYEPNLVTSPLSGQLPRAAGLTSRTPYTAQKTTISIRSGVSSGTGPTAFLPIPYPATRLGVRGNWAVDPLTGMVASGSTSLSGLTYTVFSEHLDPAADQLSAAPPAGSAVAPYDLAVPASYDSVRKLAGQITAAAGTPFAKAIALQSWLNHGGKFSYTLDAAEVTDATSLRGFLTAKRGFCQQFAFAMAVFARLVGIPSRIAVGYTQGVPRDDGSWIVKTTDAHSWPELYFSDAGWIPFEPTPSGLGGQGTATPPAYTLTVPAGNPNPGGAPGGNPSPTPTQGSSSNSGVKSRLRIPGNIDDGTGGATAIRSDSALPWEVAGLSLLGLLLLAVIAPSAIRLAVRRRRWLPGDDDAVAAAHAAWRELHDDLADFRVDFRMSESPRALAGRITTALSLEPTASDALGRVAMAEERALYSAAPASGDGLRKDSAVVRHALASTTPPRARWRARLFPASVLGVARAGLGRRLDWLVAARDNLTARLPRLPARHR